MVVASSVCSAPVGAMNSEPYCRGMDPLGFAAAAQADRPGGRQGMPGALEWGRGQPTADRAACARTLFATAEAVLEARPARIAPEAADAAVKRRGAHLTLAEGPRRTDCPGELRGMFDGEDRRAGRIARAYNRSREWEYETVGYLMISGMSAPASSTR